MQDATRQVVGEKPSRQTDFPSKLLARISNSEAIVVVDGGVDKNGDVHFSIPMRQAGLSRPVWSRTPIVRTPFFVNLLGEILVRKNIGMFSKLLTDIPPDSYDKLVNCFKHRHFGMDIDENDILRFQFHISLVQKILTEDVADIFA